MIRKIIQAILVIFMIGIIIVLYINYRQVVPLSYFIFLSSLVVFFLILQTILHKWFKEKIMLLKILDLMSMLIFVFLAYIIALITLR